MTDTMKDSERPDFGFEPDPVECWNCGGEGYVSCCFEEYACIDPESGCDECERRCDICNGRGVLPAGPQEDQQPSGAGLEDDLSPTEAMAIACGLLAPAGQREAVYNPERDLEPCLEARLFVTPESLDAFMEANPLPPDPAPDADVAGLVERLRTGFFACPTANEIDRAQSDMAEAADAIEALQAEVERLRGLVSASEADRYRAGGELVARATAAEAEAAALRAEVERKDKALAVVREQAARTDDIALALLAQINPHVDLAEGPSQLFFALHDQIKIHGPSARRSALGKGESPADTKAGG